MVAPEDELARLQAWCDAFRTVTAEPPTLHPFTSTLRDSPHGLQVIRVPRTLAADYMVGTAQVFGHAPAVQQHIRAYGFAWGADARMGQMPSPATYEAVRGALGRPDEGFDVTVQSQGDGLLPVAAWLLEALAGRVPLALPAPEWLARDHHPNALAWTLTSLVHDTTVHLQNYVCVPRATYSRLEQRIRERIPARFDSWREPGAVGPLTLSHFLDNTFNTYCHRVWWCVERPDDFARVFSAPANFDQLMAALDVRIDETERGLGDVASGQFDEMPPLAPIDFTVRKA